MTQKQTLDNVLIELLNIKKQMPNGELKALIRDVRALKEDLSELKHTLLNPEDGVIVKTNQNTQFRQRLEKGDADFQTTIREIDNIGRWKDGVTKALWIVFSLLLAIILRLIFENTGLEVLKKP